MHFFLGPFALVSFGSFSDIVHLRLRCPFSSDERTSLSAWAVTGPA